MPVTWPLVERRREFDAIAGSLSEAAQGRRGTVLTGPAGVGKTTLARQVTSEFDGVRWIAGTESARSIPLGAFANVVAPTVARDTIGVLSAARESLLSRGSLVLGVDDAHLLDPLSATLLHQLALDGDARIVVTVRSGETPPDAVTSLWKDGFLERIELVPFTQQQSVDLVEEALGGHLEGFSARLMWEASGGNALFLRHLIDGALECGHLRDADGVWQLRGSATVTAEFATLLDDRIDTLPDPVRGVLDLLSLCEPMELDLLCELAGDDAVDHAESRELIRVSRGGNRLAARFTHPLFGEVIRARLGRVRSRRLRGRVVEAMQERGLDTDHDRLRLAELAVASDHDIGVTPLIDAARVALGLSDVAAAERFARSAFDRERTIHSVDLLARALLWQGRPDEVEQIATTLDPAELDEIGLLRWGMTRACNFSFSTGDSERAADVLRLLRERVTAPGLALVVDGMDAFFAMHANRIGHARDLACAAVSRPDAPPTARYWAAVAAQRCLALTGQLDRVREIAACTRVASGVDGLLRYQAAFGELQALVFAGDLDAADECAAAYAEFSSPGQYVAWGMSQTLLGCTSLARGHLVSAIVSLQEATAAFAADAMAAWSFPARTALVQSYALLGETAAARDIAVRTRSDLRPHVAVFDPPLTIAEAWLMAAEGLVLEARKTMHAAARSARSAAQHTVEMEALHALVRLGECDAAGRLAELAGIIDGHLAPLYARHAGAVASRDAGVVEDCAAAFAERGYLVSAADAAAHASALYARRQRRADAVRTAALAHRLAAECGGLRTPALDAIDDPLPLTAREREIANLVAAGMTNRQIGDRLTLSPRTVEGHIYRACTKLDVSDRGGLGERVRSG
ncbi:LuxR family transcriptional regulator [Gordonia sp. OPL2]|uniref:helix-turn-helix transcriptional regulator n=1 Tax=Gordonia sp. OPL2 TaxID=2486274 RepID=UPI0016566B94|nr:LuxR family transcriptional regulator [Gordonia sp. OPL2]ROZ98920.1 LuxR family transcriptional regulator [Gordonia sp. OPL2]